MKYSSSRHLLLAALFLAFAASVLGSLVYLINVQGAQLTAQLKAIAEERAQESAALQLERLARSTQYERDKLAGYFLAQEGDSIDFLADIETNVAPSLGLELSTDALDRITVGESAQSWIQISFNVSGTQERVLSFLYLLETLPYASYVTDVDLQRTAPASWSARITLQIQLRSHETET